MVQTAKSLIASLSIVALFVGTLAAQNQPPRISTFPITYKNIPRGGHPPTQQLFVDSLFVRINNVSISDSTHVHGLSAAFSSPILSFISIVDKQGKPITGLADTLRWLGIDDISNNGRRVGDIWQPVLEYHEENPAIPSDPDVTHQTPGLLVTEVNAREPLQVNTVIAMDHSGSMRGSIETAKAAARTYVEHMRNGDQAAVIKFSSEVRVGQHFTRDQRLLIQAINRQPAGGRTLFYDALIKSVELIKDKNNRRAVIAYTDGFDNGSTATAQAAIDSATTYGIPIFTIGIGDSVSQTILQDIAVSTGGIFLFAPTVNELEAIFLQLSTVINNYYVTAHTSTDPVRNNTWRIVDITVNHEKEKARALGRYFIPARKLKYDLAVSQVSTTDSVGVIDGRQAKFAKPGETYSYQLRLANIGKEAVLNISLVNFFPDSINAGGFSIKPVREDPDSASWRFNALQAGESVIIDFKATVRATMPIQRTALINTLQVAAERDTFLANNFSADTVYTDGIPPPPPRKRIDVAMSQISTTDSVSVDSLKIVKAGETYSYQLKVSNVGDSTASNIYLTNIFPDSISASGFSVAPQSVNKDSANWNFASLAVGASITINFEATVHSAMPDQRTALVNISRVVADGDTSLANNLSADTVYAVSKSTPPPPRKRIDVAMSQVSTTDSSAVVNGDSLKIVKAGETYSYQLKVSNVGDSTASNIHLTNIFPDSISASGFSVAPQSVNKDSANWTFASLATGASITINFDATVHATMPDQRTALVNISRVAADGDTSLANNLSVDTVYAVPKDTPPPPRKRIDVAMSQISTTDSVSVDSLKIVKAGETYSYQLKVSNVGDSTASNIYLTNIFPDSISASGFSVAPQSVDKDSANWNFASLAVGASITINFEATVHSTMPDQRTALVNISRVAADGDTSLANNLSVDTVYAVPKGTPPPPRKRIDVAMSQISTTDSVAVVNGDSLKIVKAGETYSYQLKISNVGDSTASDIHLTNIFPDSISASGFSVAPQSANNDSANWNFASLAVGASITINFEATVYATMPDQRTTLINISRVATDGDTTLANNLSADTVYAVSKGTPPPPRKRIDVAMSQISTTDSMSVVDGDTLKIVKAGETYSYQLKVSNVGDSTASDIHLTNIFPDSISASGFSVAPQSANNDSANWNFASLAVGASITINFEATVYATMPDQRTTLINISRVAIDGDTTLANNLSADTVYAVPKGTPPPPRKRIDVAMSQISTTDSSAVVNGDSLKIVKAGETYSYQLKISNVGDSTASDIHLTNIFPDSISASGFSVAPLSMNKDSANWSFASLALGASITINFEATVHSAMPDQRTALVNISRVAADGDTLLSNNLSADTVYAVSKGTPPLKGVDVAISQKAITDSIQIVNGDTLKFVQPGETYAYELRIKNIGNEIARNVLVTNVYADSISADEFNIAPTTVNKDSAQWLFSALEPNGSIEINFHATVRPIMPIGTTELINIARVEAEQDTTLANNVAVDNTVIAVNNNYPPHKRIDVAMSQISTTDSVSVDSLKIVKAGETYSYQLKVSNVGDSTASNINLTNIFPDSISASGFSVAPQSVNKDSTNWNFASLAVGASITINFDATVHSTMPDQRTALINISRVAADGDTSLANNLSADTVYAVSKGTPPPPRKRIDVAMSQVSTTDSVSVVNGDTLKIVKAGETYSYQLKVSNVGDSTASDIHLTNIFPDSISASGFSVAPQSVNKDSANWNFASLAVGASITINFEATVYATMPDQRTALVNISRVAADGDTSLANNLSVDTVYAVPKGTPPPPRKRIDVAMSQVSTTDSVSVVNGDSLKIVKAGETYSYQLKISNVGDSTASNINLTNIFPDSISASGFSVAPQSVNKDSANWSFASLAVGASITINFEATVHSTMPDQRTALVNISRVAADGDTSLANNLSVDTVYAVPKGTPPPPRKRIDVAMSQISTTDSVSVDSVKIVKAGETYSYQLKISNVGDSTASNIHLTNVFPDSISASGFSVAPQSVNKDSANWNFAPLAVGASITINFEATVYATMPDQRTALVNISRVAADGDTTLVNNLSADTVYAVRKPAHIQVFPEIVAIPENVQVGDSIKVSIRTHAKLEEWDLIVRFADGSSIDTYADAFIAQTPLQPEVWYTLSPVFTETSLRSSARVENIVFELHSRDVFGDVSVVQATVVLRSANAMVLDRNVFDPGVGQPLGINFKLSSNRIALLELLDITGRRVTRLAEQPFNAGWNTYNWDGRTDKGELVGSGVYLVTIKSEDLQSWRKVVVVR